MRRILAVGAVVLSLCGTLAMEGSKAWAAPAQWSLQRASFGIDAKALITKDASQPSQFAPGAYFSYSAASNLSLASTIERSVGDKLTIFKAGARVRVLDTARGDIAGALNYVNYSDEGSGPYAKVNSYDVGITGAWDAIKDKRGRTSVWLIGSVYHDPENALTTFRAGARFQVFGGIPAYEPDANQ